MEKDKFNKIKNDLDRLFASAEFPEEPFHSINTYEWLMKLMPDADEALQIAALGHDIERVSKKTLIHADNFETYDEYKQAHAWNSAELIEKFLENYALDKEMINDIKHLVANHEFGGDSRVEALKNADKLSFFNVSLPLFFDRKGPEITRKRAVWGFKMLPEDLQQAVRDFSYPDDELNELMKEALGE